MASSALNEGAAPLYQRRVSLGGFWLEILVGKPHDRPSATLTEFAPLEVLSKRTSESANGAHVKASVGIAAPFIIRIGVEPWVTGTVNDDDHYHRSTQKKHGCFGITQMQFCGQAVTVNNNAALRYTQPIEVAAFASDTRGQRLCVGASGDKFYLDLSHYVTSESSVHTLVDMEAPSERAGSDPTTDVGKMLRRDPFSECVPPVTAKLGPKPFERVGGRTIVILFEVNQSQQDQAIERARDSLHRMGFDYFQQRLDTYLHSPDVAVALARLRDTPEWRQMPQAWQSQWPTEVGKAPPQHELYRVDDCPAGWDSARATFHKQAL